MFKIITTIVAITACMALLVRVANIHLRQKAFRQRIIKHIGWTSVVLLLSAAVIFTVVTLF